MKIFFINKKVDNNILKECYKTLEKEKEMRCGDTFKINNKKIQIIDFFSKDKEFLLLILSEKENTLYFNNEEAYQEELKEIDIKKIKSLGLVKGLTNKENYYITY